VKPYVLQREQWIPRPVDEVFAYFADAQNLEAITPPWLGFRILTAAPVVMQAGTRIAYRIRWHGWPMQWLTEIQSWAPPTEFVDVQVRGPYRLWHHTHRFESLKNGTSMRDVVQYALPLGFVGRMVHRWLVEAELKAIFDYRAIQVARLMGVPCGHE
jgi:ligand-binding SRPBCC domain-containing protein